MTKLEKAIKALKIYDECMGELSFFVGHVRGRVTDAAHDQAIAVCKRAMTAQAIFIELKSRKKAA